MPLICKNSRHRTVRHGGRITHFVTHFYSESVFFILFVKEKRAKKPLEYGIFSKWNLIRVGSSPIFRTNEKASNHAGYWLFSFVK